MHSSGRRLITNTGFSVQHLLKGVEEDQKPFGAEDEEDLDILWWKQGWRYLSVRLYPCSSNTRVKEAHPQWCSLPLTTQCQSCCPMVIDLEALSGNGVWERISSEHFLQAFFSSRSRTSELLRTEASVFRAYFSLVLFFLQRVAYRNICFTKQGQK